MLHQAPAGEVMGMLAKSFLEDEELARTALGCHLSMNLFLPDARLSRVTREFSWQSDGGCTSHLAILWAARVGKRGLKQLALVMLVFLVLLREESVLQTPGLQVLHRFRQSSTGGAVINSRLPRRRCFKALQKQKQKQVMERWRHRNSSVSQTPEETLKETAT